MVENLINRLGTGQLAELYNTFSPKSVVKRFDSVANGRKRVLILLKSQSVSLEDIRKKLPDLFAEETPAVLLPASPESSVPGIVDKQAGLKTIYIADGIRILIALRKNKETADRGLLLKMTGLEKEDFSTKLEQYDHLEIVKVQGDRVTVLKKGEQWLDKNFEMYKNILDSKPEKKESSHMTAKKAAKKAAAVPKVKAKGETVPKAKTESKTGPKASVGLEQIIHIKEASPHKRAGSRREKSWNCIKEGITVENFLKKGGDLGDLRFDLLKGYITVK
jgi:hypothetical protein